MNLHTSTNTSVVWVCPDCIIYLANDELPEVAGHYPPLARLRGLELAPGMARTAHECAIGDVDYGTECDCEVIPFSSRACDGCDGLAGERHAVTVWHN